MASFGFKKSTKAGQKVGINVAEEGPATVSLSAVEKGGVFRTVDGLDADLIGKEGKKHYVIPKIENTYQAGTAGNKFTPTFKPPTSDAPVGGQGSDKFELAAPSTAPAAPQLYGLQHVQRKEKGPDEDGGSRAGLGGSITERLTAQRQEEAAYQRQVEELPDMAPVEVRGEETRNMADAPMHPFTHAWRL
jgi:G patch domain/KOW motif-containing protein